MLGVGTTPYCNQSLRPRSNNNKSSLTRKTFSQQHHQLTHPRNILRIHDLEANPAAGSRPSNQPEPVQWATATQTTNPDPDLRRT